MNKLFCSGQNQYILFSGTSFENGQDVFRHLNDLFFILYTLFRKGVSSDSITLAVDTDALEYLDKKTNFKKVDLISKKELTYYEIIKKLSGTIISVENFERDFKRDKTKNLVFFASGHGSIDGLSIEKNNTYLTPDYFELNKVADKTTFLYLSQCAAGAFHHMDTRNNIVVLGASEYQSSVSIPIKLLKLTASDDVIEHLFSFYENIPINPFIYTFFINVLLAEQRIRRKHKNILNLYKYISTNTLEFITKDSMELTVDMANVENNIMKLEVPYQNIQQPYLLNKILSTEIFID